MFGVSLRYQNENSSAIHKNNQSTIIEEKKLQLQPEQQPQQQLRQLVSIVPTKQAVIHIHAHSHTHPNSRCPRRIYWYRTHSACWTRPEFFSNLVYARGSNDGSLKGHVDQGLIPCLAGAPCSRVIKERPNGVVGLTVRAKHV